MLHTDPAQLPASSDGFWAPAFGALVFALHPLRVEPVAWASGWHSCQSLVFMLASANLYSRAIEARPADALGSPSYWISVLAFASSALSYPLCLEWPLVLILLDMVFWKRWRLRRAWLEKIPFIVVSAVVLASAVSIRAAVESPGHLPAMLGHDGLADRGMKAFTVWANAILRTVCPVGLRPVYAELTSFDPMALRSLASAFLLVGITVLLIRARRQHPLLFMFWLAHLAMLGTKLGLLDTVHVDADRYTYPAAVVWAGAVASGFVALGRFTLGKFVRLPLAVSIVTVLGVMSFRQQGVWRNNEAFFQAGLASVGDTGFRDDMLWRLALARWRDGDLERALPLVDEAITRKPADVRVRLMRAGMLRKMGRERDAQRDLIQAVRSTGAQTSEEALLKISQFVDLQGQ